MKTLILKFLRHRPGTWRNVLQTFPVDDVTADSGDRSPDTELGGRCLVLSHHIRAPPALLQRKTLTEKYPCIYMYITLRSIHILQSIAILVYYMCRNKHKFYMIMSFPGLQREGGSRLALAAALIQSFAKSCSIPINSEVYISI